MEVLETLSPVIGTAAVAPALLVLWLVVAADERPVTVSIKAPVKKIVEEILRQLDLNPANGTAA